MSCLFWAMSGGRYRRLRRDGLHPNRLQGDEREGIQEVFGEGEGATAVSEGLRARNESFSIDAEEEFWSQAEEDGSEQGGSKPIRGDDTGRGCTRRSRGRAGSGRIRARGQSESTPSKSKGKNFSTDEERQLTRSVLSISQDPICGNKQKHWTYWKRIASHFNSACVFTEDRSPRSLETKWRQIKHDISEFVGAVSQVRRLHKSGISEADVIQCAHKIYKNKNPKNLEFGFEHCWCLVRGFLCWAEGWGSIQKSSSTPLCPVSSGRVAQDTLPQSSSVAEGMEDCNMNQVLRHRPSGSKAAKLAHKEEKLRDFDLHAQAKATSTLAKATLRKADCMEEQNFLFLMTTSNSQITSPAAQRFLELRREEELEKYEARRTAARTLKEKQISKYKKCRLEAEKAEAARLEQEARDEEETARQLRAATTPVNVGDNESAVHDDTTGRVVIGLMMSMSRLLQGMPVYTKRTRRLFKTHMNSKGS